MKKGVIVLMVCAVLLVSATAWALNRNEEVTLGTPKDLKDFFVDSEGKHIAIIVVGENAPATDVTGAAWIAAAMETLAQEKGTTIDPESLIINDNEVTEDMKNTYNILLVGGPELIDYNGGRVVRNTLTKELCDMKHTTIEGSTYMYVIDAFAKGKDVIIVVGEGREGPKDNAKKLAGDMI
jgi:hypothetical protein